MAEGPFKKLRSKPEPETQAEQQKDSRTIAITNNGSSSRHFRLEIQLNGQKAVALLDSGAQGNYISARYAQERNIPWQRKESPYKLVTIEGKEVAYGSGTIDQETGPLQIEVCDNTFLENFDITDIPGHDVVLGIP